MRVITLTALCLALAVPLLNAAVANAQIQPHIVTQETLQGPTENWFIAKTGSGAYVYDAMTGQMQGLLSLANYAPAVQPYAPRKEIYAAESYYSRGVHGVRTDVVTVYDYENLSPVAEIEITNKIAALSFRGHLALTGNGRHLAVFNMTPAQSISIVDVENRNFVGEISTPGCAIIMPVADNDFLMLCGDGTLQLIQLNDDGGEANRIRSNKFFDVDADAVYDRPVATRDGWLLVTHAGEVFNVSTSGARIDISDAWSIVTEGDLEEEWRPGGDQLKTVHKGNGFLYVLMHQGGEYTHHEPGTELWMLDIAAKRRIARVEFDIAANNIMVTQEDNPKLVITDDEGGLHIYDALQLKLDRTIEDPGPAAALLEDF